MPKKNTSKKGAKSKKRPTKAELERKQAINRMVTAFVIAFVLFFGIIRLGIFGVTVYNMVRFFVGSLAYPFIFVWIFYLFGFRFFKKFEGLATGLFLVGIGLLLEFHACLFTFTTLAGQDVLSSSMRLIISDLSSFRVTQFLGGGMLGAILYKPVAFLFTNIGAFLIGLLFMGFGLFIMSPYGVEELMAYMREKWLALQDQLEQKRQKRFAERELRQAEAEQKALEKAQAEEAKRLEELIVDDETGEILYDKAVDEPIQFDDLPEAYQEPEILAYEPEIPVQSSYPDQDFSTYDEVPYPEEINLDQFDDTEELDNEPVSVDFSAKQMLMYKLPSIDLFAPDKPKNQSKEKKIVRDNIRILEETFRSFGIDVKVERAEIGPSVTKYEIKPAVGVRVNRISNLADDLALALAAKDVRIEAPIPGKSLVGIEVPNSEIATVSFRELWEQSQTDPEKLLEVPLGKAVNGSARSFDLARMPHLLVAGSTGSGKSVAVNGIISSILMKARPDQVKFLMVDPKMVELSVYNDIPHLLIPVVTNPRKAAKALQKVVDEMENRYELFSHFGVRNIAGYNAKVEEWNSQSQEKQIPLPLIVVIVDELADLMMVASKEVEDAIIRLGQKARAAGIHMILATQRPSVDVISGLIKANVPSRVAFAVSSGTDSRTILDENGAEKLLGRGDMLFKPIDENHPIRLQGSFISDDDVERIVSFIKNQAEAQYDDSFDPGEVAEGDLSSSGNGGAAEGDPLFEEAKALVLETQKASASMLQRRLSVGFNRATRLMEELEEAGVIGPAEGTKPRKVLMTNS
ncbi:DNA translocase FtsK [Streptococcus loxodontisalivarius]|uniref:DNA translocase FtsK n=1 Tax=Streptococcus loxodontisalivarius TaxID=1349415 RepID=A0ABS2PU46_9STRE|nr:DNA translocase FtsK [Streptococcus loxodontisalivarius]MBM7643065.1 S-DNA-T family DNA segregation ATPase FtsK/SpoIIIE [Streptococcus loxodontisalivarius]